MSDIGVADGVYNNPRFMHACTTIVGHTIQVHTIDGSIWEGVFNTFSPKFTISLLYAIEIDPKQNNKQEFGKNIGCLHAALKAGSSVQKQRFFESADIVRITALSVDLNIANKDSGKLETDAEISGFDSNKLGPNNEPQLECWKDEDADESKAKIVTLEATQNGGWDPKEMFNFNEKQYGVKTTWNENFYTSAVPQHDTKEWREKHVKAAAIAKEIEGSTKSKERYSKEDGDEEEKYSAVHRPIPSRPEPSMNRQANRGKPRTFTDRRNNNRRRDETETLRDFGRNLTIADGPRQPHNRPIDMHKPISNLLHQPDRSHDSINKFKHNNSDNNVSNPNHRLNTSVPPITSASTISNSTPNNLSTNNTSVVDSDKPISTPIASIANTNKLAATNTSANTVSSSITNSSPSNVTCSTQNLNTSVSSSANTNTSVSTSNLSSNLSSGSKDSQNDLAKSSKLNPNAKEFVYRPQSAVSNQSVSHQISDPYNQRISVVPGTNPHHPQFVPNHPQQHFPMHYVPHFSTPQPARYVRNSFQPMDYNNMRPDYSSPYPPMGAYPPPHPQQSLIPYPPQPQIYHVVPSPMHVVPNTPYDGTTPMYMTTPNYVVNNS